MSTKESVWTGLVGFFVLCILILISSDHQRDFELEKLRMQCHKQESQHE